MKVLEQRADKCDATLREGKIWVVDLEIRRESLILQLSDSALARYKNLTLYPAEWLRIADRIGPSYWTVAGEVYSRFGRSYSVSLVSHLRRTIPRRNRFPSVRQMRKDPFALASVAIAWEGEDCLEERRGKSLGNLITDVGQDKLLTGLEYYINRSRQTREIQDIIDTVVCNLVREPNACWVEARWKVNPEWHLSSLVELSLRVFDWPKVLEWAIAVVDRIDPKDRYLEASSWNKILQHAPESEQRQIRQILLDRVTVEAIEEHKRPRFFRWLGLTYEGESR